MLKPGSNYRMSKQTKTSLALDKFKDHHARGAWKRAMVEAELASVIQPKREKGKREPKGE